MPEDIGAPPGAWLPRLAVDGKQIPERSWQAGQRPPQPSDVDPAPIDPGIQGPVPTPVFRRECQRHERQLVLAVALPENDEVLAVVGHRRLHGEERTVVRPQRLLRASWTSSSSAGWLPTEVVLDAGYDAPRIAHLLADLPVEILGRMRSDRVMRKAVPVPRI